MSTHADHSSAPQTWVAQAHTIDQSQLAKQIAMLLIVGVLLGWMTLAPSRAAPTAATISDTSHGSPAVQLEAMHRALREFDRFLDHHPLVEDELRREPTLSGDDRYLRKNPELAAFLAANPDVLPGLHHYPRYFLFHALLQQANAPLRYSEIAPLKEVLDEQPSLERALVHDPELIRNATFVHGHPSLAEFFDHHAQLQHVFLPPHPISKTT